MKKILVMMTLGIFLVGNIYAAFEDTGWTARGEALGNAIFGEFDGVHSMHYNPATLAMLRGIQFYGDWGTPFTGLNDGSLLNELNFNIAMPFWNSFTIPGDEIFTKRAAFGFSFRRMSLFIEDNGGLLEMYHEGVYSFIYAKDLNDVISRGAKISVGVKLSLYDIGVGATEDVLANPAFNSELTRLGFGLDIGVTYDFSETIRLGLVFKNLIPPNISILPDGQDFLPSEFRLGANWDMGDLLIFKKCKLGFGMVSYGRGGYSETNDNRQAESSYNLGFEFKQLDLADFMQNAPLKGDIISFRLGAVYQARTAPLEGIIKASVGLGLNFLIGNEHRISLDYTGSFGINDLSYQQSAGLTYEFLFPNSAFAYKDEEKRALEYEEKMAVEGNQASVADTTPKEDVLAVSAEKKDEKEEKKKDDKKKKKDKEK